MVHSKTSILLLSSHKTSIEVRMNFSHPYQVIQYWKKAMLLYKYKKGQRSDFAMFVTFMVMQRWPVSTLHKQSTLGLLSNMTAHGGNVETVIVLGSDTSGSGSITGCVSSCVFMARVNRDISLDICNKKWSIVMSRCEIRWNMEIMFWGPGKQSR